MKWILFFLLQFLLLINGYASSTDELKKLCGDEAHRKYSSVVKKEGKSYRYIFVVVTDEKNRTHMVDCSVFGIGPVLNSDFKDKEMLERQCDVDENGPTHVQTGLVSQISEVVSQVQCENKHERSLTSPQCTKDVICNITRSLRTIATFGLTNFLPKTNDNCLSPGQSDCMTTAIAGVIKAVWENIKGIGTLGKAAYNGVKSFFTSRDAELAEIKSSQSLHAASKASPGFLATFRNDPIQAFKDLGLTLYKMFANMVAKNFACEKWAGVPHVSTCIKPMNSWDCASCNQKINAMCGVIGIAGGEIVTAFITGGTLNILGKAGKVAKIDSLIANTNKIMTATKVGAKALTFAGKTFGATAKVASSVMDKVYKIPVLGSYIRLMDEAFMAGYQGPKTYFALRAQERVRQAHMGLTLKQDVTDLSVAQKDLTLAQSVGDKANIAVISERVSKSGKAISEPSRAPTAIEKVEKSAPVMPEKFFTEKQKLEIIQDPDFYNVVNKYPDPTDQEKAIEIISILKNHSKKKLTKAQILEEFDKQVKQCF